MEKTALLRWFFLALTSLFPDAERKKGEQGRSERAKIERETGTRESGVSSARSGVGRTGAGHDGCWSERGRGGNELLVSSLLAGTSAWRRRTPRQELWQATTRLTATRAATRRKRWGAWIRGGEDRRRARDGGGGAWRKGAGQARPWRLLQGHGAGDDGDKVAGTGRLGLGNQRRRTGRSCGRTRRWHAR